MANLGITVQSFSSSNPILFNHLVEHPSLRAVEAYLYLLSLEFHTIWHITQKMANNGFTEEEISEAMNIYVKF